MGKGALTIVGIAIVAVTAIFLAKFWIKPAQEDYEREQEVLTKAYEPRLEEIEVLQDIEVSDLGLEVPDVGSSTIYIRLTVLYPGAAKVPDAQDHALENVDGDPERNVPASHAETETDDDGTWLYVVFRVDESFEHARLVRGRVMLLKRFALE